MRAPRWPSVARFPPLLASLGPGIVVMTLASLERLWHTGMASVRCCPTPARPPAAARATVPSAAGPRNPVDQRSCRFGDGERAQVRLYSGGFRSPSPSQVPAVSDDVTRILCAIEQGDPSAADQLLPLVYDELRQLAAQRLAQEKPGQTLEATALVHEAYLRLVDTDRVPTWDSRCHFFAACAGAVRRILIDHAREKLAQKRGGDLKRVPLDEVDPPASTPSEDLLALDEALEQLTRRDPTAAQLVKLRYFAGLSMEQAAAALNLAVATAYRQWGFARAWLHSQVAGRPTDPTA